VRVRYLSYLSLGIAAAFLVVATVAFPPSTVVWLSLGLGIGTLAVSLGIAARSRKDLPSLVISACIAAVSAWTIISTLVFSQRSVDDLAYASALATGALAVAGLTAHELRAERVVHSLEVRGSEHEPRASASRASANTASRSARSSVPRFRGTAAPRASGKTCSSRRSIQGDRNPRRARQQDTGTPPRVGHPMRSRAGEATLAGLPNPPRLRDRDDALRPASRLGCIALTAARRPRGRLSGGGRRALLPSAAAVHA
jgi:hypothetical protein